ncbi:hypothetical protein ACOTDT_19140 [Achromobacter xylosoxidans]|nr:phage antirepressor [Achromobacter denitrificans]
MNQLIQAGGMAATMSSIDLLQLVNDARREYGEGEVRRNDFTARCKDELEGEYYETFVVSNAHGPASEALRLSRDQCMYVLMRESKAVRRAVTARLNEQTQSKVLSPEEMFLAQAQMMVEHRQRLIHNEQAIAAVRAEIGQLAETRVWDHCPQNCEPITKIRARMNKRYGLPAWVVDMVMRELPLSLKVHGMVRNNHESAEGSHYEVWAVADVTRVFKQFVSECTQETAWFATHPMIPERFKLRQIEGGAA